MLNLSALFYTEVEPEPCLFGNLNLRDDDRQDIAAAKNEVRIALRDGIPASTRRKATLARFRSRAFSPRAPGPTRR